MEWIETIMARLKVDDFDVAAQVKVGVCFATPRWERDVREMIDWCEDQCRQRYRRGKMGVEEGYVIFEFERDTDGAMFKLRFG